MAQPRGKEGTNMRCTISDCLGEYEQTYVLHTVRYQGEIVVIDHVPADVCSVCGDVLFSPQTVRQIEQLLRGRSTANRVAPVYEFTAV